jgi:hypothetical protein
MYLFCWVTRWCSIPLHCCWLRALHISAAAGVMGMLLCPVIIYMLVGGGCVTAGDAGIS